VSVTQGSERKRVFSGIQPTGVPHLGNYIGAIRRWVRLQEEFDAFYCLVDLHALSVPWDPNRLHSLSLEAGATLIACGIDPERSVVFRQSQVRAHTELAWILTCVARMGELRRMVQFKEKSKGDTESVGVGLFTYPVLQAADVLAYRAHGVPVGEDQRQHIELMRTLGERFNRSYGEAFVIPEAWVPEEGARIMALDDPAQKMSKSSSRPNSVITVTDPPETIVKKIRSAVTDSGREVVAGADKPALTNLLTILSQVSDTAVPDLVERFSGSGYAVFKKELGEAIAEHLAPIRERFDQLMADPAELDRLLLAGAEKAAAVAEKTMIDVRARAGLALDPQ
jgi:tryptophanyl-tRNA synthetase